VINVGPQPTAGTYDDELLDKHFITGDGRGNENIGLTTVHFIFHAEHNRLVDAIKATVNWRRTTRLHRPGSCPTARGTASACSRPPASSPRCSTSTWCSRSSRARCSRTSTFLAEGQNYDVDINPAIVAEFADVVYRVGHSMLTETVDRLRPDFNLVAAPTPRADRRLPEPAGVHDERRPDAGGRRPGAIVRGMTRQVGNEIDEFVTEALRNNLLGLPLDLAAINIARGRDTGVPTLNEARREFYAMTGDSAASSPTRAGRT
jgi:hypothetical protein